ncbi:MAG: PilZ domain-containing protein [Spirochaetaceae bacterium]|jgi:c-di-GMP-binding flagellar brake protein YcgR|nr:PilZ domain-containing protein [Spirochaetaceae bacterium]
MMLSFSGIPLFLLQENIQYFKEDDPMAGILLLIGIGAILVVGLLGSLIKHGIGAAGLGGSKTNTRQFSVFTLYRLAKSYGLNKEQQKLLEQIFKSDGVTDPQRIMQNPTLLDKHFKQAYRTIERTSSSEEEEQRKISLLFSLRNTIDNAENTGNMITTTTQVTANSTVVLIVGKDSYPVKVLSSGKESLSVECPRNVLGDPVKINAGAKVTISFFTKSSQGFSFDTRVVDRTDTSRGTILQVAHSNKVKNMAQRKSRRKQAAMVCNFYLVFIEESGRGRKKKQKLILDKRKFPGTILDISIGGCAIKTSSFIAVGSRLKIEIAYSSEQQLAVLGQVLRINRSGAIGAIIMHIKFLKVPRRAWNAINAMVFEYAPA